MAFEIRCRDCKRGPLGMRGQGTAYAYGPHHKRDHPLYDDVPHWKCPHCRDRHAEGKGRVSTQRLALPKRQKPAVLD